MQDKIEQIKAILKELDLKLESNYKSDNDHVFITKEMMLIYNQNESSMSISFNVTIRPDFSSMLSLLLLDKLKVIVKGFFVMDCYYYDEKNNYLKGDNAHKQWKEEQKNKALVSFVNEQREKMLLHNDDQCFTC